MSSPLRIGILGAARIAKEGIVEPARVLGHELVAVAARDRGRAEAFANEHGVRAVHETYAEVIADRQVDVVYNALVNSLPRRVERGRSPGWEERAEREAADQQCRAGPQPPRRRRGGNRNDRRGLLLHAPSGEPAVGRAGDLWRPGSGSRGRAGAGDPDPAGHRPSVVLRPG